MKIPPVLSGVVLDPARASRRRRRSDPGLCPRELFITGAGWAVPASSPELQAKIDAYLSRAVRK